MASVSTGKILVIDDEEAIRQSLSMILDYEGYETQGTAKGQDGLRTIRDDPPDLVLLDVKMPGMDGLEVLRQIKGGPSSDPVVIMISGHGTIETAVEATRLGAFDFLEKPLERERVLLAVRNALRQRELAEENRSLRLAMEEQYRMVGDSPGMQRLLEAIQRAAPTHASVLITGESGTGKELVARAIHANSPRSNTRFVQVNCAALPKDLIESELFGHEKGAFTGATKRQVGKFELANGGTIFLDEIGDMSFETQAKVLRVLQEGEVERLGSSTTQRVDVRVISATNRDLEARIAEGLFREDLFFRINVVPIHVPPLRKRKEDVPQLVRHFARRFCTENNQKEVVFSDAAMEKLTEGNWRGNIRELKNVVERVMILSGKEIIEPQDLPVDLATDRSSSTFPAESYDSLKDFKEAAEKRFLLEKLEENEWNISRTAQAIKTPRSNLYKKLEHYGIKAPGR